MDINDFLNKDIVEFLYAHYDNSYISRLQCIAEVNRVIQTPYYEECLQGFQAMDPYNNIHSKLDLFETYANHLLQLHTMIETEKTELIQFVRNSFDVSQIYEKIKQFHDKKDKLCKETLHHLEYILEYQVASKLNLTVTLR